MKQSRNKFLFLCFLSASIGLSAVSYGAIVPDQPEAFLRWDFDRSLYYVAVTVDAELDTHGDYLKKIKAAVYQDGKLLFVPAISGTDGMGSDFTVSIDQAKWIDRTKPLTLVVFSYPARTGASGFLAPINVEFSVSLKNNSAPCEKGFAIVVDGEKYQPQITPSSSQSEIARDVYLRRRAGSLFDSISSATLSARIEAYDATGVTEAKVQVARAAANPASASFSNCLYISAGTSGLYDLELLLPNNAPAELPGRLVKTKLQLTSHKLPDPAKIEDAPKANGKRPLEDNLDAQLTFSSAVKDELRQGVLTRFRDTKWKGALRFAPWLNVLKEPNIESGTFYSLTPFFIDARVSSGKVNKDTLSLNRVYIGSEFEIRHYSNPSTYPTYQRWILRVQNASDRDFKQVELTGGLELQPVFSKLNRPLRWDIYARKPTLNPDPKAAPINYSPRLGFGYQFLPQLGFQLGKTYRNKNPVAAINKSGFVRRFYAGGTLNLDLTSYVRLAITDVLYFRGERPESIRHNYFSGTGEVPLPSWSRNIGNAFFVNFERGGQPPFASADVNAITFGYRLQWAGWFDKYR